MASEITGRVWSDTNTNGLMDAGEPGLHGALVEIVRTSDSIVGNEDDLVLAKVDTDAAGVYVYPTPGDGKYYLRFLPPTGGGVGYRFTLANVGTDETIDSDVIAAEGRSEVLQQSGGASLVVGAGLIEEPSELGLAFTVGGPGTQHGKAVATDAAGNIYIGGWFGGPSLDLDPGPGVALVTSRGGSEAFAAKYDANGRLIWGQSFGSVAADMVRSIAVDSQGNVYLAGEINQTAYFGTGEGALVLSDILGTAGFIVKLDPAGKVLWGHRTEVEGAASDVALDESGAVYVSGAHFGDGSGGIDFHLFVWKLNPQGTTQWMAQTSGGQVSSTESIAVHDGKVYVTGTLGGTIDFDPSDGVLNLTSAGNQDFYLWKLSAATGTLDSAFRVGGPNYDRGYGLAVSGDGSVYVTGHFWGAVDFDPTAGVTELSFSDLTGFVAKYDQTGKLIWVRTPSNGGGGGQGIVVDASGNSWSVGSFVGTVDLDPSPNAQRFFTSKGNADVYILGLTPDGQLIDAFSAGGLTWDYPSDVALSPSGERVLATGNFEKSMDFDPGAGLYSFTALPTATGSEFGPSSQDGFLWAIGPADIVAAPVVARGDEYTTREGLPLTIAAPGVLANDSGGGGSLTAVIGDRPAHGTLELREDGSFTYVPAENYSGPDSFTYRARQGETLSAFATVSLTVAAVNDAPSGTDKTVIGLQNAGYTFTTADFGFHDPGDSPANSLLAVIITTLPLKGSLALNGVVAVSGQFISAAAIGAGQFKYVPPPDLSGFDTSFQFRVQDNGGTAAGGVDIDPTSNRMSVLVEASGGGGGGGGGDGPANHAPSGTDRVVVSLEDTAYTFSAADFGFVDPLDSPSNSFLALRVTTIPARGVLANHEVPVVGGMMVPVSDVVGGRFRFIPEANGNGIAYGSFTFQVQDDGGTANGGVDLDPSPNAITFNVISVNDAPSFVAGPDQAVTVSGERGGTSSEVIVGGWAKEIIAGPSDEAGQSLSFSVVVSAPSMFSQQPAIDASGTLSFTPASDALGTVEVVVVLRDDGGAEHEGRDTSRSASFVIRIHQLMHNEEQPLDVSGDGGIAANDVLDGINFLNAFGSAEVTDEMDLSWGFLDVDADGFITAADSLEVVNYLNAFGPTEPPPEINPDEGDLGEGESAGVADDLSDLVGLLAADAAESAMRRRQRS